MSDNVNDTLNAIQTAFEELKTTNEANLTSRDVVLEEKMSAINTAIDGLTTTIGDIQKKAARPAFERAADANAELKAFNDFARGKISEDEYKAMSVTGTNEGGVTVPELIDTNLRQLLIDVSPVRSMATVVSVGTPDYKIPFVTSGAASGWVSEKAARTETNAPTIVEIAIPAYEMYAMPLATNTILKDSMFDIAGLIQTQASTEFARQEGAAFVSGDGTGKPKGFLSYTNVATDDAARAFGSLQYVPSGDAAKITADSIANLTYKLKAGYRLGSQFGMAKSTLGTTRTLKTSDGAYIWRFDGDQLVEKVLGFEVVELEDMPAIAANAFPIAFGNFKAGYTIVDRQQIEVLVDPYSNKPYITYYLTKRVGGGVVDSSAIKLLKVATS